MNRTPQLIRPPQVDDVWYVKLHHPTCSQELDTVLVVEQTRETVKLVLLELEPWKSTSPNGQPQWGRFKTTDVVWVELVRVMPRIVESPPCPISPSDPTAPPSEPKPLDKPLLQGRWPAHPRTPK